MLAFRALRYFKRYFLTFFEGFEAIHLNRGKVCEQIFATIVRSDKTEAFGIVKPLYSTSCHKKRLSLLTNHTSPRSKKPRVTLPPLILLLQNQSVPTRTTIDLLHCSRKKYKSQVNCQKCQILRDVWKMQNWRAFSGWCSARSQESA